MKEIKKNGMKIIIMTVFFLFLTLYITQASGYDEYNRARATTLTNQEIASFEQDLKEGKEINPSDYLKKNEKDYNNEFSKIGLKISLQIEKTFEKGMNAFFKALEDMARTK